MSSLKQASGSTAGKKLFGTDGIRGLANRHPMDPALMLRLGEAIGCYFRAQHRRPRILIGKDTRRSGYALEQALSAGICSVGVDTFFLGPLPTPGIAYLTRGLRADAGIVISASHNPYADNGIKIFSADGYKLPDAVEAELEKLLEAPAEARPKPTGMELGATQRIDDATGQYAVFLKEQFPKQLSLSGLRIALDCANGAAYRLAPKVFEELGAELFCCGVQPNGQNINDGCGALAPEKLQALLRQEQAHCGIALDGDADRLIMVDERGETLDGDELLAILARSYHKRGLLNAQTVVATVMSNMGLDLSLAELGLKLQRTQVGDRYVVEAMRRGKLPLGGEQSGHLILHDRSTAGDGVLAALAVLEVMLSEEQPLSELRRCMQRLPQVQSSIEVSRKPPLQELPQLQRSIAAAEADLGRGGRVLFRYSGTENKARLMLEGEDVSVIRRWVNELTQVATAALAEPS